MSYSCSEDFTKRSNLTLHLEQHGAIPCATLCNGSACIGTVPGSVREVLAWQARARHASATKTVEKPSGISSD